jgi:hypothetical protein
LTSDSAPLVSLRSLSLADFVPQYSFPFGAKFRY